jgi:GDP-L-fucose synthase
VDDMAAACVYVMNLDKKMYQQSTKSMLSHINVGTGKDLTIKKLAETIAKVIGYKGKIEFDVTKSDGPKRKLMDSALLNSLGWKSEIDLDQGLKKAYKEYCVTNLNGQ